MIEVRWVRLLAVVPPALAVGCTQQATGSIPPPPASASIPIEHHAVSDRVLFSPKRAKLVGTVRAPEPPADNVDDFKPIILAAYKIACPNVLMVQSDVRTLGSKRFIVVRCGSGPTRSVRVIYTGVTVPDLVGGSAHDLIDVGAFLGIHSSQSTRPVRHGEESNAVVSQDPPAGSVVPFGSTLTFVVANYTS